PSTSAPAPVSADTVAIYEEPAPAGDLHLVTLLKSNNFALSPDGLTRRVREAAVEYQAYAPVPRAGFDDYAFPADKREARSMQGYGLMLVTAFSQEPDELPLKRVYVELDGKSIDLRLLRAVSSET